MNDLEAAKNRLLKMNLTLALVKDGKALFETRSHRISGFIGAIEKFGDQLEGASLADKVAGKAVALLCVYARIKAVYAEVLSKKAKTVFEENGVSHEWGELVENVLNLNKSGTCPFERAADDISDPDQAYVIFKALQGSMSSCR